MSIVRRGRGYLYDTQKKDYVHRVVMSEHLGRPLTSDEHVHHLDGDKENNLLENLIVMGIRDHARHHGQRHNPIGKLTEREARAIRDAPWEYGIQRRLAEKYGVTHQAISHIRRGIAWKHL